MTLQPINVKRTYRYATEPNDSNAEGNVPEISLKSKLLLLLGKIVSKQETESIFFYSFQLNWVIHQINYFVVSLFCNISL